MIKYNDKIKIFEVRSGEYGQNKTVVSYSDIDGIILQSTGQSNSNNRETDDADAICYVDPNNEYIKTNLYRLEGFYLTQNLFGVLWYRIVKVVVNRDHLLSNKIDNVELKLKKVAGLKIVS